ncbi:MAG: B12-binding domain-containing protein, partial [Candidatus Thorarchaeota archaeon]
MTEEESLEKLKSAILKGDSNKAIELVNESLKMGINAKEILNKAILKGAEEAGRLYEEDEYFL